MNTFEKQSALAAYCRTGDANALQDVDPSRLATYRRLVFNVIDDTLCSAFPLACRALGDENWGKLTSRFLSTFPSASPELWRMPKHFVDFVVENDLRVEFRAPYLDELLNFEWLEIEVYMMPDLNPEASSLRQETSQIDFDNDTPVLNLEHRLCRFSYPVFKTAPEKLGAAPTGQYHLAIYRHPETLKTCFLELSPFLVEIIEAVKHHSVPLPAIFASASRKYQIPIDSVLSEGIEFFKYLLNSRLILGFKEEKANGQFF